MADQSAIDAVKLQLPDEASGLGISDAIISGQLDGGATQTKTVLFCLRGIAAKIASVEDVQESGSSRTTRFHDRIMAMITDWQARADAEDAQLGNLPPKMPAKLYTSVRV